MSQFSQIRQDLLQRISTIKPEGFEQLAMDIFRFQASYNPIFREWLHLLGKNPSEITHRYQIPYLPITFFKSHQIRTGAWPSARTFTSSGTTGSNTSHHHVRSFEKYLINTRIGFEAQYGSITDYSFLCLLPSYLERQNSSLVAMAQYFVQESNTAQAGQKSGFYLYDHDALLEQLRLLQSKGSKTVLLGVTYALLDLAMHPGLPEIIKQPELLIIMETGGMKGKRKEMTRTEVHDELITAFGVRQIHSEYGMTELLSQAYAPINGVFYPSPTLRAHTTEVNDVFHTTNGAGLLNITDLANLDTCAFICTEDLGRVKQDGTFEVIGRADVAEMRGCNLMVE